MHLRWPLAYLILLIPCLYLLFRSFKKKRVQPSFVAESISLSNLPSFNKVKNKTKILNLIEKILLGLLILGITTLIARPQAKVTSFSEQKSRDIVLCLDVSGSMEKFIVPALEVMEEIYKKNPGDRYSIVIFAGHGYTVLPLTRDLVSIQEKIDLLKKEYSRAKDDLDKYIFRSLPGFGTDIGDGILTSINRFTNIKSYKSRSIILLSDLEQTGGDFDKDSKKFLEKVALLPKYRINFYVMKAINDSSKYSASNEIVDIGGGQSYDVKESDNKDAAKSLITKIFEQALNTEIVSSQNLIDSPDLILIICGTIVTAWAAVVSLRHWRQK